MKYRGMKNWLKKSVAAYLATGLVAMVPVVGHAMPQGGVSDTANITTGANVMDITSNVDNNVINWNSFSIANGETVDFHDKNYLNLVNGNNMSEIYGTMNGTGSIYLINPNGIIFGQGANVNVGELHTSTRALGDVDTQKFLEGVSPLTGNVTAVGDIINVGTVTANKVEMEGLNVTFKNVDTVKSDDVTVNAAKGGSINVGYTFGTVPKADATGWASNMAKTAYQNVTTQAELQAMNDNLGGNYQMTSDITLEGDWTKVGNESSAFTGKFNGLNNTINGLKIAQKKDGGGDKQVGLFGVTDGADIRNVKLNNVSVEGNEQTGALVGFADKGTVIDNVAITGGDGHVMSGSTTGGIVGKLDGGSSLTNSSSSVGIWYGGWGTGGLVGVIGNGTVDNCEATGWDIKGASNTGGLVGIMYGGAVSNSKVVVGGTVKGEGGTGGAVGAIAEWGGTVDNVTVTKANDSSIIEGTDYNVGGVIGTASSGTIANSSNYVDVKGSGKVGGIVGNAEFRGDGNILIADSYNAGNISMAEGGYHAGGIAGNIYNTTVSDCYSTGVVASGKNTAGIVGTAIHKSTIKNSFTTTGDAVANLWNDQDGGGFWEADGQTFTNLFWVKKGSQDWIGKEATVDQLKSASFLKENGYVFADAYGADPTDKHWVDLNGQAMLIGGFRGVVTATGTTNVGEYDGNYHQFDVNDLVLDKAGVSIDGMYTLSDGQKNVANEGGNILYNGGQDGYYIIDKTKIGLAAKDVEVGVLTKVSDLTTKLDTDNDIKLIGGVDGDKVGIRVDGYELSPNDASIGKHTVTYHNVELIGDDRANYNLVGLDANRDVTVVDGVVIVEKDNPLDYLPEVEQQQLQNTVTDLQTSNNNSSEKKDNGKPAVPQHVVDAGNGPINGGHEAIVKVDNGKSMNVDNKQSMSNNKDNGNKKNKDKK